VHDPIHPWKYLGVCFWLEGIGFLPVDLMVLWWQLEKGYGKDKRLSNTLDAHAGVWPFGVRYGLPDELQSKRV